MAGADPPELRADGRIELSGLSLESSGIAAAARMLRNEALPPADRIHG